MNVQLTEVQISVINTIAGKYGFNTYQLETKYGSKKGDGSLGCITSVTIKNGVQKLELILKSAETNEEVRKKVPIRKAYLREIYIYEKIFSQFDKFRKENRLISSEFNNFAKMYGSCDKENSECLAIENLKEAGYKMWDRKIPMDSVHVALVFIEYGKFHAISLAMKNKKREAFKELTSNLNDIFEDTIYKEEAVSMVKPILQNGYNAVKGNHAATAALNRLSTTAETFLMEDLQLISDQLVVIHGDCWCNNMMFKYEDPQDIQKPTRVCLLDWQLSKMGSPVLDLAYFFFVCGSKNVFQDSRKYLKIYHDTVSKNLRGLSCDADTVFPFSLLEYHWKKYAKFGLYMALTMIKLMLNDTNEVEALEEVLKSGKTLVDRLTCDSVHNSEYNQRILDVVTFMDENGLI